MKITESTRYVRLWNGEAGKVLSVLGSKVNVLLSNGVRKFVDASQIIKAENSDAKFELAKKRLEAFKDKKYAKKVLKREDVIEKLKGAFGDKFFVKKSEEFNPEFRNDGLWIGAESLDKEGLPVADYYEEFVNKELEKILTDANWIREWYDPGTIMLYPEDAIEVDEWNLDKREASVVDNRFGQRKANVEAFDETFAFAFAFASVKKDSGVRETNPEDIMYVLLSEFNASKKDYDYTLKKVNANNPADAASAEGIESNNVIAIFWDNGKMASSTNYAATKDDLKRYTDAFNTLMKEKGWELKASIGKMAPGKVDEPKWKRAEESVSKSRNKSKSDFSDRDWGLVNHIYQNMGGTFQSKSSVEKKAMTLNTINYEGSSKIPDIIAKVNEKFNEIKGKNPDGFMDEFESRIDSIMVEVGGNMGANVSISGDSYLFDFVGLKNTVAVGSVKTGNKDKKNIEVTEQGLVIESAKKTAGHPNMGGTFKSKSSVEKWASEFGAVDYKDVHVELEDQADFSNRLLPAPYTNYIEANEGEEYDVEYMAHGKMDNGEDALVYWIFTQEKGNEQEPDTLPWEDVDRIEVDGVKVAVKKTASYEEWIKELDAVGESVLLTKDEFDSYVKNTGKVPTVSDALSWKGVESSKKTAGHPKDLVAKVDYESLGFGEQQTGGGCTAWVKEIEDSEILITKIDDPSLPSVEDKEVQVSLYHPEKDLITEAVPQEQGALQAVVDKLSKQAGHPKDLAEIDAKYSRGDTLIPVENADEGDIGQAMNILDVKAEDKVYVVEKRPNVADKDREKSETFGVRFEIPITTLDKDKTWVRFAIKSPVRTKKDYGEMPFKASELEVTSVKVENGSTIFTLKNGSISFDSEGKATSTVAGVTNDQVAEFGKMVKTFGAEKIASMVEIKRLQQKKAMLEKTAINLVKDIQNDGLNWAFVSDSQDVTFIKEMYGEKAQEFDSFFVLVGDGDYDAVYGMVGIVPNLDKSLTAIVPLKPEHKQAAKDNRPWPNKRLWKTKEEEESYKKKEREDNWKAAVEQDEDSIILRDEKRGIASALNRLKKKAARLGNWDFDKHDPIWKLESSEDGKKRLVRTTK